MCNILQIVFCLQASFLVNMHDQKLQQLGVVAWHFEGYDGCFSQTVVGRWVRVSRENGNNIEVQLENQCDNSSSFILDAGFFEPLWNVWLMFLCNNGN